jgi:hypothetical protein
MTYKISTKTKVTSKGDAWGRGSVTQPIYAVAGANDTGTWEDSPNPSYEVNEELKDLQKHLEENGIKSKIVASRSSNVFMVRRWIVPETDKFKEAKKLADEYLKKKESSTKYIYDAD